MKAVKRCFFGGKPDHLIAECPQYRQKQQAPVVKLPEGVGLIRTLFPPSQHISSKDPDECFKLFISKALVSLTGKPVDQR